MARRKRLMPGSGESSSSSARGMRHQVVVEVHDDVHLVVDDVNLRRDLGIEERSRSDLQSQPHHFRGNVERLAGLPLRAEGVGTLDDLTRIALDALAMKGGRGDAASALVGLAVGGDEALAEQDLHALLRAVLAEGRGLVDEHFADVGRIVEKNDVAEEDAVMRGPAEAAQVLEQQNRIARLEELAEEVEGQIHAQAGRVEIAPAAHRLGQAIQSSRVAGKV